jgi:predicted phage tail protein
MEPGQAALNTTVSKTQVALAIFFLSVGVAALVKAAFYRGDSFLWAIGALLIISGISRLRGKST